MSDGVFVTVEGIDGSGKTTVTDAIDEEYKRTLRTQEPSELWTGKQVRRAIANDTGSVDPLATFYLFMADRIHHIEEEIKPAMADGMLVVSDRYADSTLAYQPVALAERVDNPQRFIERTMEPWNYEPQLTLYLDVSVDTAMGRLDGDEEYEKREFLEQVQANYESLAERYSGRYARIDAEQSPEAVREDALAIIEEYYD